VSAQNYPPVSEWIVGKPEVIAQVLIKALTGQVVERANLIFPSQSLAFYFTRIAFSCSRATKIQHSLLVRISMESLLHRHSIWKRFGFSRFPQENSIGKRLCMGDVCCRFNVRKFGSLARLAYYTKILQRGQF
jgi:hypothetical protein